MMPLPHGLNNDDIERVMEENRVALNAELPAYSPDIQNENLS